MAAVSKPSSRTIRKHSAKITHWNPENGCSLSRVCTLTPVAAASFWTDVMTCLFHCLSAWRIPHLRADRKSTRLNSSHSQISYAVFCLKKKKKKKRRPYMYNNLITAHTQ